MNTTRHVLHSTRGTVDLASIMVGIVVMGIVGGVIAAIVFAVIPWTQDRAAERAVASIINAESVHYGLSEPKTFANKQELLDFTPPGEGKQSLITNSSKYDVKAGRTPEGGQCWGAVIRSDSEKYVYVTSGSNASAIAESFLEAQQAVSIKCEVTLQQPTAAENTATSCETPETTTDIFAAVNNKTGVNCTENTDVYADTSVIGTTRITVAEDTNSNTITATSTPGAQWGTVGATTPTIKCVYWSENYTAGNPASAHSYITLVPYYSQVSYSGSCATETVSPTDPTLVTLQAIILQTGAENQIRTVWTRN